MPGPTYATGAIITKGLSGSIYDPDQTPTFDPKPACRGGLITTVFSLYVDLPPVDRPAQGGGPYPGTAWNKYNAGDIANFYQPVPEQYYVVPRNKEADYFRRHKVIHMSVNIAGKTFEKDWTVPEERAKHIVKALNMVNTTKDNITTTVENVKRVTTEAVVKVKNFKLGKK